jgi:hypothetical protein
MTTRYQNAASPRLMKLSKGWKVKNIIASPSSLFLPAHSRFFSDIVGSISSLFLAVACVKLS